MTFPIRYLMIYTIMCVLLITPVKTHDTSHVVPQLTKQEQQRIIQEYNCIKESLWYEANGEGKVGLTAVMSVIYNRTQHRKYPDTYCAVIQQSRQFSYRNHLRKGQMMPVKRTYNAKEQQIVLQVQDIAFKAAVGRFDSILDSDVLMYHAKYLKNPPKWANKGKFSVTINNHSFYKG